MRLNRRELGTGLLGSRILLAALLLVMAGIAILGLGFRATHTTPATIAQTPRFDQASTGASFSVAPSLSHLPMIFEPNQGQTDPSVQFMARGSGYALFLTGNGAVLALQRSAKGEQAKAAVVRMRLAGAAKSLPARGTDQLPGRTNYLLGNDSTRWHRDIPQFARVRYESVYSGVDLVYYGKQGQLEYDFEVAPGADPKSIQLNFDGAEKLTLVDGDLVLKTAGGDVHLHAPRVYQRNGEEQSAIDGRFELLSENTVGFAIGNYDRSRALVIDPVLSYSSYLGGSGVESNPHITVDTGSNFYVAGSTTSPTFPGVSATSYQSTLAGTANLFVAKFDPSGATLLFSTYLGGNGIDVDAGIGVDAAGDPFVAGSTTSTNFPTTTSSAFQTAPKTNVPNHAFITQLAASGSSLLYSTYLSGSGTDTVSGMTLDNKGFVYVIGITNSTDFPTAPSAGTLQTTLQGSNAFFVSKLQTNTSGANSLVFSSYFGGGNPTNGTVSGGGIAVDNNAAGSNIFITGGTNFLHTGNNANTDFPITNATQSCLNTPPSPNPPATCPTPSGLQNTDAFIAKINPGASTGPQLIYSTYIGGTGNDVGLGIGLDSSGSAYITGTTDSADLPKPSTPAPFQSTRGSGPLSAFVAKVNNPVTGTGTTNPNVVLTYSTYISGNGTDQGNAIVVDGIQGAHVVGTTTSTDLPVFDAVQSANAGGSDAFVARIDTTTGGNTTSSQFLTYLGGSGTDTGTGVTIDTSTTTTYVTGETTSGNFPKASPFQSALAGTQDVFAAKYGPVVNLSVQPSVSASTVNAGNQVGFSYLIKNNGDTTANIGFLDQLATGNGTAPATFVSATATGGTCPTTPTNGTVLCNLGILNGGSSVSVTVNLTPSGPGTLSNSGGVVVPNVPFVPVSAKPVTVNSYVIKADPSTVEVVAGNPAVYQLTVSPQSTFTAQVAINCSTGLPGGNPPSKCTPSTTPVVLQGTSPATITLSISTFPRTTTTVEIPRSPEPIYATWLPVAGLAFLGLGIGSRVNRKGRVLGGLLLLTLMTLVLLQPACGGHSSSTLTQGTPAGTYTVTVTASSGTFSQTTPITLKVD